MKDKRLLVLIGLYTTSFFMLLINFYGVYWDDWCLLNQPAEITTGFVLETGQWLLALPLHRILSTPASYHLFTFFAYLASGILVLKVLDHLFDSKQRNLILAILFLLFPINIARVTMVCALYSASLFLYCLFLYLYTVKREKLHFTIFSFIALFLSFTTNSLLVFHYAMITVLIYVKSPVKDVKGALTAVKNNIIVYLLPIVFFVAKKLFMAPSGAYVGYNKITLSGLIKAIPLSFKSILYSLKNMGALIDDHLGLFLVLFIFIYLLFKKYITIKPGSKKESYLFILTGLFLLFSAYYPYAVVGKVPSLPTVNSRFELLAGFGFSLLAYGTLVLVSIKSRISMRLSLSVLVTLFIVLNTISYSAYLKFWVENDAFGFYLKKSEIVKEHTSFMIQRDTVRFSNGVKKTFSFYEASGISKNVFGTTDKFYSPQSSPKAAPFPGGVLSKTTKSRLYLNVGNYIDKDFEFLLTLKQVKELRMKGISRYLFYKILNNKEKLNKILQKYYVLDEEKVVY